MNAQKYHTIIVGSGVGGGTLARELTKRGKSVLVLERGCREAKLGTFGDATRFYDANPITRIPKKSKEGVIIWRAFMAGGTSVVAMGNITRCLEKEFLDYGIDLGEEMIEAEKDVSVAPLPDKRLSEGGNRIREAARLIGHTFTNMPKCIEAERCASCGNCSLGCPNGAKWTALKYLEEAERLGAEVIYKAHVQRVLQENGQVSGVAVDLPSGPVEIQAEIVILAAGGVGTPILLQKSGVPQAGEGLFIDLLQNTYAEVDDFSMMNEPQMALVDLEYHQERGFLLSTMINHPREVRLIELGPKGFALPTKRLVGIMTKIVDEPTGKVFADGSISKTVTAADRQKLDEGARISKEILIKAGASPKSVLYSEIQGAHPGGTAALGRVVDGNLMAGVKNLYVCDASVLPKAPGLPPILTLIALSKHLAKQLAAH